MRRKEALQSELGPEEIIDLRDLPDPEAIYRNPAVMRRLSSLMHEDPEALSEVIRCGTSTCCG
jgi:hypothetical protein